MLRKRTMIPSRNQNLCNICTVSSLGQLQSSVYSSGAELNRIGVVHVRSARTLQFHRKLGVGARLHSRCWSLLLEFSSVKGSSFDFRRVIHGARDVGSRVERALRWFSPKTQRPEEGSGEEGDRVRGWVPDDVECPNKQVEGSSPVY